MHSIYMLLFKSWAKTRGSCFGFGSFYACTQSEIQFENYRQYGMSDMPCLCVPAAGAYPDIATRGLNASGGQIVLLLRFLLMMWLMS